MSAASPQSPVPQNSLRRESDISTDILDMSRAASCSSRERNALVNLQSAGTSHDGVRPDPKEVADAWAELRSSGITSRRGNAMGSWPVGNAHDAPVVPPEFLFEKQDTVPGHSLDSEVRLPGLEPDNTTSRAANDGIEEVPIEDDPFTELDVTCPLSKPGNPCKLDELVVDLVENESNRTSALCHSPSDSFSALQRGATHIGTANVQMRHASALEDDTVRTRSERSDAAAGITERELMVIDVDDPNTDVRVANALSVLRQHAARRPANDTSRPLPQKSTQVPVITVDDEVVCIPSDDDEGCIGWSDVRDNRIRFATAGEVFGCGGVYTDLRQNSVAGNELYRAGEYDRGAIKKIVEFNNLSADATEEIESPPELTVQLLRHQKRAVAWMVKREQLGTSAVVDPTADVTIVGTDAEEDEMDGVDSDLTDMCRGGILADEQGLGKTLSIITLFLVNPPRQIELEPVKWRTLVVCPVSLVGQWKDEIGTRLRKEHRRSVYIYHGPKRTRSSSELASYDVVISTYTTITNEYPKLLKDDPRFAVAKKAKTPLPRRQGGPIYQCRWYRVVLDEAHNIKNRRTESWAAANQLVAEQRWCLTGTPIQNNVDDIYSLFCFIRYRFMPVNNYKTWNETWKKKLESNSPQVRERSFKRFQAIVGVVTLRRTKKDTIDGRPLITIPDRICEVREVAFTTPREMAFYQAVEKNSILELGKFISAGGLRQHYSGIMVLLLRMRQACCHPFLIEYTAAKTYLGHENDEDFYSPYSRSKLDETEQLLEAGESSFPALAEPVQESLKLRLAPPHGPDEVLDPDYPCEICHQPHAGSVLRMLPAGNFVCKMCASIILKTHTNGDPKMDPFLELDDVRCEIHVRARQERRRRLASMKRLGKVKGEKGGRSSSPAQDSQPPLKKFKSEGSMDAPLSESRVNVSELTGLEMPSTKIDIILSILRAMRERDCEEKCLIFSQWTSMMDIIEYHIGRDDFRSCRLDGTMSMSMRKDEIERFKSDKSVTVFLISMHAGGTGLNLTEASNVVLADVWWNPSVEEQCCDRAHRIGQHKTVRITRLKIVGSVEERIYEMCKRKAEICKGALGAEGSQSLGRQKMTLEDAMSLFGGVADDVAQCSSADDVTRRAALDIGRLLAGGALAR